MARLYKIAIDASYVTMIVSREGENRQKDEGR